MKTTVEIDSALLQEAQKALGTRTLRATVEASFRAAIRQQQLAELADSLETIDLVDLTPAELRRQRRKRAAHAPR